MSFNQFFSDPFFWVTFLAAVAQYLPVYKFLVHVRSKIRRLEANDWAAVKKDISSMKKMNPEKILATHTSLHKLEDSYADLHVSVSSNFNIGTAIVIISLLIAAKDFLAFIQPGALEVITALLKIALVFLGVLWAISFWKLLRWNLKTPFPEQSDKKK